MESRTGKGSSRFPGQKLLGFAALSCAAAPLFALLGALTGYVPATRGLWVPFLAFAVSGAFVLFPPLPGGWTLLAGAVLSAAAALLLSGEGLYGLLLAVPCAVLSMVMLSGGRHRRARNGLTGSGQWGPRRRLWRS